MEKKQNIFVAALIIMAIALGIDMILGTILVSPIVTALVYNGAYDMIMIMSMLLGFVSVYASGVIAMIIYYKAISKTKNMAMWPVFVFPAAVAVILVLISFVLSYGIGMVGTMTTIINFLLEAGLFWGAALLALKISKFGNQSVSVFAYQQAPVYQQQAPTYQQPAPTYQQQAPAYQQPAPNFQQQAPNFQQGPGAQQNVNVEDIDGLAAALLGAIKPSLKAPMTAILCSPQELRITVDATGEYTIAGYVNSQNSYGAMISTDFTAKARYMNGMWMIGNVAVGVQNAKNYAKSFVSNYIAISIFVAVMGGLGYLLLTLFIG